MKKSISLILALCVLFSCAFALGEDFYHNDETITYTAYVRYNTSRVDDPQQNWIFEWALDKMNIKFEVIGVTNEAFSSTNSVMFASQELPDVLFNWPINDRVKLAAYGDEEGLLLPYNDLISEEVTPNLYRVFNEKPELIKKISQVSGNTYALPRVFTEPSLNINPNYPPIWINTSDLAAAGIEEIPRDLDSFLDVLRKLKEADPRGIGEAYYPLGGSNIFNLNFTTSLLNSFGFSVISGGQLVGTMNGDYTKNDIVVVPYQDNYYEYLSYMHTLYEEGLIDPDFYTLDDNQVNAKLSAGQNSAIAVFYAYNNMPDNFGEWEAMVPLTSAYQETPMHTYGGAGDAGYFMFITKACKNPEPLMRFIDVAYDPDYKYLFFNGPKAGVDETYGLTEGWTYAEDGSIIYLDVISGARSDKADYVENISPFGVTGNFFDRRTDGSEVKNWSRTDSIGHSNLNYIENIDPYLSLNYPGALFDSETQKRIGDLESVISDYVNTESAKFIVGARSLSTEEWEKYKADLDSLGMQEYIALQEEAFEAQFR